MTAKKSRRITSVGIALGLFTVAPAFAPIAHAQTEEPQANVAASESTKGSLNWALRDSFLRYSLGATNVGDGATKIYSNGTTTPSSESDTVEQYYKFNLKNVDFQDATKITRAEFEGSIEYFKYCEGRPAQRGNCALELTIKDPTIVLSPEGSYVEADVRSKQYPSGEIFQKDDAKIAQAWTKTAKFEENDGKVSWSGINTSLTEDGVRTFSNFYDLGGPLAPLSFEYEGAGARPGNDTAPLTIGGSFRSSKEVDADTMLGLKDYVALATRVSSQSKTAVELIDPATMQAIGAPLETPLQYNETLLYTEGAGNRIYWVEGQALKSATASASGWSEPVTVHDNVGIEPVGIAYDAAKDRVAVIARGTNDNDSTLTWVTSGGQAETVMLTPAQDVVSAYDPEIQLAGGGYNRNFYGEAGNIALPTSMSVMPDGNILYLPAVAAYLDSGSYRVPPVLIQPDGSAKLAEGGTHLGTKADGATYATKMATDGMNVAFYSHDHGSPGMQFFRYEEGALKPQSVRGPIGDLKSVSEVTFVNGQALVANESNSMLSWVNPVNKEITDSISLPNQKDTSKKEHTNLLQWKDKLLAYSIETDNETYLEHAVILRLDPNNPDVGDHTQQVEPESPVEPVDPAGNGEAEKPADEAKPENPAEKPAGEEAKPSTEQTEPTEQESVDEQKPSADDNKEQGDKKGKDSKKSPSIWERITGFFSNGFEKLGQLFSQLFNWLFKLGNGLSS